MKVTFLGFVKGSGQKIGIGRQGRGSGNIYFFGENNIFPHVGFDNCKVGEKIELDEYFLEIPEKEFIKIPDMIKYFGVRLK